MNREDKLKGLQIDACPFANLPERERTQWALTREDMKNCIWVKPELVAQIEFGEWTPDGHLRHSKFIGLLRDALHAGRRREIVPMRSTDARNMLEEKVFAAYEKLIGEPVARRKLGT